MKSEDFNWSNLSDCQVDFQSQLTILGNGKSLKGKLLAKQFFYGLRPKSVLDLMMCHDVKTLKKAMKPAEGEVDRINQIQTNTKYAKQSHSMAGGSEMQEEPEAEGGKAQFKVKKLTTKQEQQSG